MKGNNKMSTCRILFHRLNNITLVFSSIVVYKFKILVLASQLMLLLSKVFAAIAK